VFQFCRAKCHRAFLKKRNPRKVKWTKAFRKAAGKEMRVDATFEFEKRRNTPVRYDRELVGATIGAMKRVKAIQEAREKRFHDARMAGAARAERALHRAEIAAHVDLIKPAAARKKEALSKAAREARAASAGAMAEEDA
jgi:large subunit ribosomal protein L24e